jgi:hypothetical protein
MTHFLHTPPRPRTQQAWELAPTANRIPPPPAGTRIVEVLPNQAWSRSTADDELARFTADLS